MYFYGIDHVSLPWAPGRDHHLIKNLSSIPSNSPVNRMVSQNLRDIFRPNNSITTVPTPVYLFLSFPTLQVSLQSVSTIRSEADWGEVCSGLERDSEGDVHLSWRHITAYTASQVLVEVDRRQVCCEPGFKRRSRIQYANQWLRFTGRWRNEEMTLPSLWSPSKRRLLTSR